MSNCFELDGSGSKRFRASRERLFIRLVGERKIVGPSFLLGLYVFFRTSSIHSFNVQDYARW